MGGARRDWLFVISNNAGLFFVLVVIGVMGTVCGVGYPLKKALILRYGRVEFQQASVMLTVAKPSAEVQYALRCVLLNEGMIHWESPPGIAVSAKDGTLSISADQATVSSQDASPRQIRAVASGTPLGVLDVHCLPHSPLERLEFTPMEPEISPETTVAVISVRAFPEDAVLDGVKLVYDAPIYDEIKDGKIVIHAARDDLPSNGQFAIRAVAGDKDVGAFTLRTRPPKIKHVKFSPEKLSIGGEKPAGDVSWKAEPSTVPAEALKRVRFKLADDEQRLVVDSSSVEKLHVAVDTGRAHPGESFSGSITAYDEDREVGRLAFTASVLARIERVWFEPSQVELTDQKPSANVQVHVEPSNAPAELVKKIEFARKPDDERFTFSKGADARWTVAFDPARVTAGHSISTVVTPTLAGKTFDALTIQAAVGLRLNRVIFTPEKASLSADRPSAQVRFSTDPPQFPGTQIVWKAPEGVTLSMTGSGELDLKLGSDPPAPEGEGTLSASFQGTTAGKMAVEIRRNPGGPAGDLLIRAPQTTSVNTPTLIEVIAENTENGERIGTIAVSISGCAPVIAAQPTSYDLFLPSDKNAKLTRFAQEGNAWLSLPMQDSISPQSPHVEIYDAKWPSKASKKLSFTVTFNTMGTARFYFRTTFTKSYNKDRVIVLKNIPETGQAGQQGLPCRIWEIEVK
jgi:hypothetical protein